jgi:XTP/dITP diphosphohydrolase
LQGLALQGRPEYSAASIFICYNPDMERLLIATNNKGKIREFQALLAGIPYALVTPNDLNLKLEVEETGVSYEANARLKARAFSQASGLLTLADDSGLEVDALNGEPGIHSARYAGPAAKDGNKIDFLLSKLQGVPEEKRTARFRCVIAIAGAVEKVWYCEGKCEGRITLAPRGAEGFGYDPVFLFPEMGKTMAELPEDVKNQISHRGRAAFEAVKYLKGLSTAV